MRKKLDKFAYILIGVAAVIFIAAMILSWSISRIGDKPFEIAQLWFSAAAFVASGLGLIALVWTFYEQRRLTQNQSRAYLEIISVHVQVMAEDEGSQQINVSIVLRNTGNTPALNVDGRLTLNVTPESGADDGGSYADFFGSVPELPTRGTYRLLVSGWGRFPHASAGEHGWRHQYPHISADGAITYNDVFTNDVRRIKLDVSSGEIAPGWFKYPIELSGPHNDRFDGNRQPSHYQAYMADAQKEREAAKKQ